MCIRDSVRGKCVLENIPAISDITYSFEILRGIGAEIKMLGPTTYEIDCTDVEAGRSDYELVRKIRGSYYLLGAEFGRFGRARVGYPGGCNFGVRPIDQHIKGFEALGGRVTTDGGYIEIESDNGAVGTNIFFDVSTVGATLNIMIAAATAEGTTIIDLSLIHSSPDKGAFRVGRLSHNRRFALRQGKQRYLPPRTAFMENIVPASH